MQNEPDPREIYFENVLIAKKEAGRRKKEVEVIILAKIRISRMIPIGYSDKLKRASLLSRKINVFTSPLEDLVRYRKDLQSWSL